MSVGRQRIRASAHNLRHGMLVRWQADDGAGRNALLDSPANADYQRYRHMRGRLHCECPVQVTRRATERRFVSGDKPDTAIRLVIISRYIK
jgi:hypothetical protein